MHARAMSCQGVACFNTYCVRSISGNMKCVGSRRHLQLLVYVEFIKADEYEFKDVIRQSLKVQDR